MKVNGYEKKPGSNKCISYERRVHTQTNKNRNISVKASLLKFPQSARY